MRNLVSDNQLVTFESREAEHRDGLRGPSVGAWITPWPSSFGAVEQVPPLLPVYAGWPSTLPHVGSPGLGLSAELAAAVLMVVVLCCTLRQVFTDRCTRSTLWHLKQPNPFLDEAEPSRQPRRLFQSSLSAPRVQFVAPAAEAGGEGRAAGAPAPLPAPGGEAAAGGSGAAAPLSAPAQAGRTPRSKAAASGIAGQARPSVLGHSHVSRRAVLMADVKFAYDDVFAQARTSRSSHSSAA